MHGGLQGGAAKVAEGGGVCLEVAVVVRYSAGDEVASGALVVLDQAMAAVF